MRGRLITGLLLLAIGVAWIADLQGYVVFPGGIGEWWPSLIILWGLVTLLLWRGQSIGWALFLLALGGWLQAWELDLLPADWGRYVVPALLVVIGLAVLAGLARRPRERPQCDEDFGTTRVVRHEQAGETTEDVAVFSEVRSEIASPDYRGGEFTAVFGSLRADLRRASLPEAGASVKATGVFGSVELVVPTGWRVELHGTHVFGDMTDRTARPAEGPVLRIEAVPVFGNVRVSN